jgi:hypothetical protein
MFAIRSGNFQLSLMLATALAVSAWPAAGHAYPPFTASRSIRYLLQLSSGCPNAR